MQKEEKNIANKDKYSEDEKKRAAYALNMCTVSVAQIIDYNDVYVLEQEYEAILNNLNLENIPSDEAFLKILVELLNTITFFRIQEKRKDMIDRQYQKRMKDAIWSAVPNIGLIVAGGNPMTMLFSLATQVGAGYMNYRKEKANIASEKEKEELELEIAAIEQFNALRRELFTTAWRIAKEYKFPDAYRLTEKQIKQYNDILMDPDDERKFIRLEAIRDNFEAYPPYWYHMGHAAAYLAGVEKRRIAQDNPEAASKYVLTEEEQYYVGKAKEYFHEYYEMNKYNILREDQITASFALEYVDLLMSEEIKDNDLIRKLLTTAKKMSGCAYDVMQLCAISYLQIGDLSEAAVLLKQLVNEEYNVTANAKLLSRVYVAQYLSGKEPEYFVGDRVATYKPEMEYKLLTHRVNDAYLFRMPEKLESDVEAQDRHLQSEYIEKQKQLLIVAYRKALVELEHNLAVELNHVLFPNGNYECEIYETSEIAKKQRIDEVDSILKSSGGGDFIAELKDIGFRYQYSELLNKTVNMFDVLRIFKNSTKKDALIQLIRKNFIDVVQLLNSCQQKLEDSTFKIEDYKLLQEKASYGKLTGDFFDKVRKIIFDEIFEITSIAKIEEAEADLLSLCDRESLSKPDIEKTVEKHCEQLDTVYFEYEIFGDDVAAENNRQKKFEQIEKIIEKNAVKFESADQNKVKFIKRKDDDFDVYFSNTAFDGNRIKAKTVAILDDRTFINDDILFTVDGLVVVSKNKIRGTFSYSDIEYSSESYGNEKLIIGKRYEFSNGIVKLGIDVKALKKIIDDISNVK